MTERQEAHLKLPQQVADLRALFLFKFEVLVALGKLFDDSGIIARGAVGQVPEEESRLVSRSNRN